MNKSEKQKQFIDEIEENLNDYDQKQEDRLLLTKAKQFRQLLNSGLLSYNTKVGKRYLGFWLKNINGCDWAIKICKEPQYQLNGSIKESVVPNEFYTEILCEKMARACGMRAIDSKVFKYAGDSNLYGIMSKDYRRDGFSASSGKEIVIDTYLEYLDTTDYFQENYGVSSYLDLTPNELNINSLPIIYQALRFRFERRAGKPDNLFDYRKSNSIVNKIYSELVQRYIFTYITMQYDFHLSNWEILDNDFTAYLSEMYDLEKGMSKNFYNEKKHTSMKYSMSPDISIDEDFQLFLKSDPANIKDVETIIYLLTPQDVLNFMQSNNAGDLDFPVEYQKEILSVYSNHFQKIEQMLEIAKRKNIEGSLKP